MDLWLAPLGQVDDIDPVVVEVFHAAVEVLPQKDAGFTGQRDAAEAQLWRKEKGSDGALSKARRS